MFKKLRSQVIANSLIAPQLCMLSPPSGFSPKSEYTVR